MWSASRQALNFRFPDLLLAEDSWFESIFNVKFENFNFEIFIFF